MRHKSQTVPWDPRIPWDGCPKLSNRVPKQWDSRILQSQSQGHRAKSVPSPNCPWDLLSQGLESQGFLSQGREIPWDSCPMPIPDLVAPDYGTKVGVGRERSGPDREFSAKAYNTWYIKFGIARNIMGLDELGFVGESLGWHWVSFLGKTWYVMKFRGINYYLILYKSLYKFNQFGTLV